MTDVVVVRSGRRVPGIGAVGETSDWRLSAADEEVGWEW